MKYCYPDLGGKDLFFARVAGPGLGNMLFPWARATVAAQKRGYMLIEPTWPQIKIGPFIRGERDGRSYSGLFTAAENSLHGVMRLKTLLTHRRVPESAIEKANHGDVVVFSGMADYFKSILAEHGIVMAGLRTIADEEQREGLGWNFSSSVCVHVRLGDFASGVSDLTIASGKTNVRIPLEWYRDVVEGIRAVRGRGIRVFLFSDGDDKELAPLLELDGCTRLSFGSALADLLALSRSELLVASGSTFSMWASYLGRMPVFWYPGQRRQRLYSEEHNEPEVKTQFESMQATKAIMKAVEASRGRELWSS
jgi:hypothetical protein